MGRLSIYKKWLRPVWKPVDKGSIVLQDFHEAEAASRAEERALAVSEKTKQERQKAVEMASLTYGLYRPEEVQKARDKMTEETGIPPEHHSAMLT